MNRQEAADFLGVSVRTLERLAAEGRIAKGRTLRKTRPSVEFAADDLARLKTELHEQAGKRAPREYKQADTIGFRLDPLYVRRLTKSAEAEGMSPGEYARHLVVRSLEDDQKDKFSKEVFRLREGLADAIFLFLTTKCDTTEADANSFVRETILKDA